MDQITQALQKAKHGNDDAVEQVWLALHSDIRNIAGRLMAGESPTPTLQPTVLINEAYLKLFGGNIPTCENRQHFLAMISKSMSRYLIDRARKRKAIKRGGDLHRVPLTIVAGELAKFETICSDAGIQALVALEALHEISPQAAEVAHLRFVLGLTVDQSALAMSISPKTVKNKWAYAKAWLRQYIEEESISE
ncbi:hypothetical protein H8D29_06250 [PVC group bacterium]|nr:hypothetical protein [PVC group bacterium]